VVRLCVISRISKIRKLRPTRVAPPQKKIDSLYYYSELVHDTITKSFRWPSLLAIWIDEKYFQFICLQRENITKIYPHRNLCSFKKWNKFGFVVLYTVAVLWAHWKETEKKWNSTKGRDRVGGGKDDKEHGE